MEKLGTIIQAENKHLLRQSTQMEDKPLDLSVLSDEQIEAVLEVALNHKIMRAEVDEEGAYLPVELTEEEKDDALRIAVKHEKQRLKTQKYWDSVFAPKDQIELGVEDYWTWIQRKGKKLLGRFDIDDENEKAIRTLCYYFADDPEFEKRGQGFSLKKGLMLYGPIGCGKTTLMRLFETNQRRSFRTIGCMRIAELYRSDPKHIEHFYEHSSPTREARSAFRHFKGGWFFDDLGREGVASYYGNNINTMQSILQRRYSNPELPNHYTHISTNLFAEQIEEKYGAYLGSRLQGTMNVIEFPSTAKDRRL